MIKRDHYGFIVQHNADYPEQADGGDTARSTGLMAMTGSFADKDLMDYLIHFGKLVRHPYQSSNGKDPSSPDFRNWTLPSETSRDQVLCYSAGVEKPMLAARLAMLNYAQGWFVNKDILLPHNKLALYKAAYYNNPGVFITVFGYLFMFLHVIYNALIKPEAEQNQTIAMLHRFPTLEKLFYRLHPDIEGNLKAYFGGKPWRDQDEIAEALIQYIRSKK